MGIGQTIKTTATRMARIHLPVTRHQPPSPHRAHQDDHRQGMAADACRWLAAMLKRPAYP